MHVITGVAPIHSGTVAVLALGLYIGIQTMSSDAPRQDHMYFYYINLYLLVNIVWDFSYSLN